MSSRTFYLAYVIGVMTLGEIVVVPAIYFGYVGRLNFTVIFALSAGSALLADLFWFSLGRFFPKEKIQTFRFIRRRMERAEKLGRFFRQHRLRMIFFSKFFYGTRVVIQVMAGLSRVPVWMYIAISIAGNLAWLLVATVVGIALGASLSAFKEAFIGTQIAATAGIVLAVAIYFLIRRHLARKRLRQ